MKEFKKIISVVLIVSLVFSMSGVITLAESIDSENLQEQTLEKLDFDNESLENESKEDLNVDSSLSLTETNDEIIKNDSTTDEVSLIGNNSVSTNSDIIDFEEEEESNTLLEEPEEEPEEDPEIALSETNQNIFDIESESNTDITEIESTNYPIDYSVSTLSDTLNYIQNEVTNEIQNGIFSVATLSNTLLDEFLEENKSTLSNAGFSAIDGTNIASISDAKESNHLDINISSKSEINDLRVATTSDIASNNFSLASLSEITIASESQLFGGANINVGQNIYFGYINQLTSDIDNIDPILWRVLEKDDEKAYLLSDKVIAYGAFNYGDNYTSSYLNATLVKWLDENFYMDNFTYYQKLAILPHPTEGTMVFLPGQDRIHDLLGDEYSYWKSKYPKLLAKGTDYIIDFFKKNRPSFIDNDYVSYWFGEVRDDIRTYYYDPKKQKYNEWAYNAVAHGVRPAVYIRLNNAYWQNKRCKLTWELYGGKFVSNSQWPLINEYVEKAKDRLPSGKSLIPPNNQLEFKGWKCSDDQKYPLSYIPETVQGDITVKAIWDYKLYDIIWDLSDGTTGNQGTWDFDPGFGNYKYGTGRDSLPQNVIGPHGRVFDHWEIDGKKVTSIGKTESGTKTIKAVYKNSTYNITWDLVDEDSGVSGVFKGEYPANYEYSKGIEQLPLNVIPPAGKVFDHWEIAGVATMSILPDEIGDKTLKATYIDSILFGTYPQNDETGSQLEPIRWRIIKKDNSNNEALLIADNVLYTKRFSTRWSSSNYNYAWKLSEVRRWLNDTFKMQAFPEAQRNGILNYSLDTVNQGNSTEQIHLITRDEAYELFVNKDSLKAKATNYAKNVPNTSLNFNEFGCSSWWLRTKSNEITGMEEIINYDGEYSNAYADSVNIGIRPAIYLDLSSNIYKSSNNHIRFDLKGGSFKDGSKLWEEFTTYQGGQKLPDASNIIPPNDDTFIGWVISGDDNIITEIAPDQTGDLVLEAVYGSIWFGTYPQNDTTGVSKEPIKWRVLKQDGNEILLVSDKLLDNVSYNNERSDVNWEDSDIRNWLNTDFTDNTFTIDQINDGIITKTITTRNQPDTQDKIFLLSDEEANIYSSDDERKAKPTLYAKNVSNGGSRIFVNNLGFSRYWLRTSAGYVKSKIVFDNGAISSTTTSFEVSEKNVGVRPAFYANLDSDIFRFSNNKLTWDLNGGKWKDNSKLWEEMSTYQGGQKLPTADNLIAPENQEFLGWSYYGEIATISEIESDRTGNIILVAKWTQHPYHITWDLMDHVTGIQHQWYGTPGPDTYIYGVGLPSFPTNIIEYTYDERDFDHFEIIGSPTPFCISPTDYGDKVISAVFKNKEYDIFYDLEDGHTGNFGTWGGDYPARYTYGVGIPELPTNVIGPYGREFYYWQDSHQYPQSAIGPSSHGDVHLKAYYVNKKFNINYSLGFGHFETGYTPINEYEYSVGTHLPDANKVIPPNGKAFSKWILNFDDGTVVDDTNDISNTAYGNVGVIAEYCNATYSITYTDSDGVPIIWDGVAGPSVYTHETGIPHLPTNVAVEGTNEFDHWEINNIKVTGISPNSFGDIVVVAKYRMKTYSILWHLDDLWGYEGDWDGEAGKDRYTYSTEYILPTNIIPPKGTRFSHWMEEGTDINTSVTSISRYDSGNKEFRAVYESELYNITWDFNGASIIDQDLYCPDGYTYRQLEMIGGIDLPDESLITNIPSGKVFSHFVINGAYATQILPGTIGDITVTLIFKGEHEHNIFWEYGVGEDHWGFDGWIPPATFSEGVPVMIPDDSYLYRTPNGREIDYFLVNGVKSMEINGNSDVVVTAVLKDKSYRIKYNLGTGHWDEDEGASSYTHGTEFRLPTNVLGATGYNFSHWEINGVATTSILPSDYGHKEFTARYEVATYDIFWNLKSSTIDPSYDLRSTYTYGEEIQLPDASLITTSDAREFDYWTVNGARMTSILPTYAEFIVVSINYVSYPITWDLGKGKLLYYDSMTSYDKGERLYLPEESYILPPNNYTFDYWTINGNRATEISNTQIGAITIKAIYKNSEEPTPTPTPRPYYPSGGGGAGGGGGGGRGGGGGGIRGGSGMQLDIPKVSEVATIKFINKKYAENEIVWVYDPISNKYMLHIKTFDSEIPAMNGFFVIDREVETKVNGTLTQAIVTDTYYFDSNGNMLTGWIHTLNDDKWYFFDNSKTINEGKMYVLGWYQIENKWYYFDIDGRMLVNTKTPDGLHVGADGAYVNTQTTNT